MNDRIFKLTPIMGSHQSSLWVLVLGDLLDASADRLQVEGTVGGWGGGLVSGGGLLVGWLSWGGYRAWVSEIQEVLFS